MVCPSRSGLVDLAYQVTLVYGRVYYVEITIYSDSSTSNESLHIMNWTGGQLHRYSTRSGVLSKAQRQSFAKSRQLASNKPSPPRPFVGLGLEDLDAPDAEIQDQSVTNVEICTADVLVSQWSFRVLARPNTNLVIIK